MTRLKTITGSYLACGIATLGDGWTVAVLPKPWPLEAPIQSMPDRKLFVLKQGQTVQVLGGNMADDLQARLQAYLEQQDDDPTAPSPQDDPELIDEVDRKRVRNLLIPGWRGSKQTGKAASVRYCDSTAAEHVHALLNLMQWAVPNLPRQHLDHQRNPLLTPWLESLFVSEVERNFKWLRRGYVPETADLGAIRGRVDPASLVRAQLTRSPSLRCHFDEFTEAIPHFRVLATALDRVGASGRRDHDLVSFEQRQRRATGEASTLEKARHLRFLLADLQPLPLGQAVFVAKQPLPVAFRKHFQCTVDLALAILAQLGPAPAEQDRPNPELAVATSTLFEVWVHACLTESNWPPEETQPWICRPWPYPGSRHRRADLVCKNTTEGASDGDSLIVDCKFKVLRDEDEEKDGETALTMPAIDDVNQVFAYARSGLASEEDPAEDRSFALGFPQQVLLVYLATGNEPKPWPTKRKLWRKIHEMNRCFPATLTIMRAPFPPPECFDATGTDETLTGLAVRVGEVLASAVNMAAGELA